MKNENLFQQALFVLRKATIEQGILALVEDQENYKRVWSRDASIAGIAGLMAGDEVIIKGLRASMLTLAEAQAETGAIPSNVNPDTRKASYGSLAGRVDATTWWLIASAIYSRHTQDETFIEKIKPHVVKAFAVLRAWEFNERHLLYTPLSGNWADEYPLHGYLLYDNCLRLWALKAWNILMPNKAFESKLAEVEKAIVLNFWATKESTELYHPKLQTKEDPDFWLAGFHPGGPYTGIFDAAGNAFACLLGLGDESQNSKLYYYLNGVADNMGNYLIPAFWPAIQEGDPLWRDIANNFAYHFKNEAHHFHNGGSWPVMAGWLILALKLSGIDQNFDVWQAACEPYLQDEIYPFPEYINTKDFKAGGKCNLSFSAAGYILMSMETSEKTKEKLCLI